MYYRNGVKAFPNLKFMLIYQSGLKGAQGTK